MTKVTRKRKHLVGGLFIVSEGWPIIIMWEHFNQEKQQGTARAADKDSICGWVVLIPCPHACSW